ncbi:unnamed protein product [Rhizoctonia solani]|uniref:Zn(2)-C6 fungal-type domain-containing protein n=1 Tax=Rhizoctonia solani TaxID=456999 RepID=A0A8H2XRH5_9AGAM|nr:unnamed protein product [Rhizoctonia solani]
MEQTRQRSRKGCLTCREKRKKCDEVKPVCGRCGGGDECIWPASKLASKSAPRSSRLPRIQPRPSSDPKSVNTIAVSDEISTSASEENKATSSVSPYELSMDSLYIFPEAEIGSGYDDLSPHHFSSVVSNTSNLLLQLNDSLPVSTNAFRAQGSSPVPSYSPLLFSSGLIFGCMDGDSSNYGLDEDEEETFKPSEWLPATLQLISLYVSLDLPFQDRVRWSSVVDAYFTFLVRYSYDPSNLPVHIADFIARHYQVESVRLGILGSSLLFYSFLNPGPPQVTLRTHAYELINAATTVLQTEMAQANTTLNAQLAGISEVLSFYYFAGDLGGYIKYIGQAAPVVQRLVGTAPVSIHKLYGSETLDIRLFAWCDVFSAMATSRPTWLAYDCNADALLSRNQKGQELPYLDSGLEWMCGLPDAFLLLTIQILNLTHASISPTERIARAATIEAALRSWKVWPSGIPNSVMRIQRVSAQEIWRHSTILYLYQVIHKATSNQEVVQQSVKQIIKLASTLRPGHNPDCLLYIPYFLAGTFAVSVKDRQFIRSRLMTSKGKQRATNDEGTEPEQRRPITIRFTEHEPDLLLGVSSHDTIRDVKALIRSLRPSLERRRLRLVHAGRLLTDGTRLVPWLEALEAHSRKSNANNVPTRSPASSPTSASFPPRRSTSSVQEQNSEPADVWIHCSIGSEGDDTDGDKQQESQIAPLRGFDRLASAGFSAEDIESMRRQFHAQRPEVLDQDDEHARALEEQWVDNMDSGLPGAESNDGEPMYPPYFHGILIGFFFPLIPMFFLRELPPPAFFSDNVAPIEAPRSVVYSRRMQMALVAGFFANIVYGTLNYFY